MVNLNYLEIQKALARKDFFEYCKLKAPDFYMDDRGFLVDLAGTLQGFM